jgi:TatD DNase family protein
MPSRNRMGIIDTHAHLSDLEDRGSVMSRAKEAGVEAIITMGSNLTTSIATIEWADEYPGYVHPAIGIHPTEWMADDVKETLKYVKDQMERIVAVGEIGLDYWDRDARKDEDIRETQRHIYVSQLQMARENEKPVSVHGRGSWRDALDLAVRHGPERVVFHWYSGPLDVLSELLDRGYYLSATPATEYSRDHRAALEAAPLERIMLETDSPVYMRNRKRNSEPSDVVVTLNALAKLKEIPREEVERITTENAKAFFRV